MILKIPVVAGAAVGVCSAVYFLGLMLGTGPYVPLVVSLALISALAWWTGIPPGEAPRQPLNRWIAAVFFVGLAAAMAAFLMLAYKEPHGDWDAWSIWNLHARFLERGGAQWTTLFSKPLSWSNPDYPLLLPAFVAQIWSAIGVESTVVPIVAAFVFTFGTVAVVVGAVRRYRGWNEALVAGAVLLGCTDHLVVGAAQFADVPLAFYIAASLTLLCIEDLKCTLLAGAMAGFAAWTKNEGLWFLVVLIAARTFARWRMGRLEGVAREMIRVATGAVPVLVVLAIFKIRFAPANQLLFGRGAGEVFSHALDFGRYFTVIEGYIKAIYHAGGLLLPAVLVLAVYAWMVRFNVEPGERLAVTTVVSAVILMLAGDFVVYVLFPNDLVALINTSVSRVFTQIWPTALVGFFWATSGIEFGVEATATKSAAAKRVKKAAATRRG